VTVVGAKRLWERAKYKIGAKESFLRVIRAFKNKEGFSKQRLTKRIVKNILQKKFNAFYVSKIRDFKFQL
jgi:hypothetical protein